MQQTGSYNFYFIEELLPYFLHAVLFNNITHYPIILLFSKVLSPNSREFIILPFRDPALMFRSSAFGVAICYKIALARVNGSFSCKNFVIIQF
jgi:hypothetical protein